MFRSVLAFLRSFRLRCSRFGELGQSTAEYALVILGAVAIASLLITWASSSHAISKLFDSVVSKILPG
ncbi:MAG: DUF4244 domain-containing protein [Acidimicrobiia bacterium]